MGKKLLASLALLGCLLMAGCANTVAGAGEDISNVGNAITKSTK
ncbi:entericidin A/B family lipoprotein [Castellaniella sp. S9]|nr:entericidin A/B family lipoprotein [Castellaniella sp. S9]